MEMFYFILVLSASCKNVHVCQNAKNGTSKRVHILCELFSINLKKKVYIYFKLIFNSY